MNLTCSGAIGGSKIFGHFSTRAQIVMTACACAGLSAFLFEMDPQQHSVYPRCLLYQTTGIYCAGCGATRAAYALLHGRFLEALHDNLLFVSLLPLAVAWALLYSAEAWQRRAWPEIQLGEGQALRRVTALGVLLVAFMIARNLPGWPFSWLRPL